MLLTVNKCMIFLNLKNFANIEFRMKSPDRVCPRLINYSQKLASKKGFHFFTLIVWFFVSVKKIKLWIICASHFNTILITTILGVHIYIFNYINSALHCCALPELTSRVVYEGQTGHDGPRWRTKTPRYGH